MTHLRPMTPDEFARWRAQSIPTYAADKVRSGRWAEAESLAEAEKEFDQLLPQGLQTPGHTICTLGDDAGQSVGALWVARTERAAGPVGFIYDLVVWPEHRGKGHARRAMRALEVEAAKLGFHGLALHVFGHNTPARALYDELGYEPTNINMFKPLGAGGGA